MPSKAKSKLKRGKTPSVSLLLTNIMRKKKLSQRELFILRAKLKRRQRDALTAQRKENWWSQ